MLASDCDQATNMRLPRAVVIHIALFLIVFSNTATMLAQRSRVVYRPGGDTTQNSYRIYEATGTARGLVVLLPMFGGDVDSFASAALPRILAARGVVTIVVSPTPKFTSYLDDEPLTVLNDIISEVVRNYGISDRRVVIGGISAGGTGAVRFAQHCALDRCASLAKPVAVFAVDAALDFERWWRSQELALQRASPKSFPQEAKAVMNALRKFLGGSPTESPETYRRQSPFLAFAPDGGNARLLREMPIRLYTEPDIAWRIENFGSDYYTSNVIDQAALILQLQILGNQAAELVTTSGKGYRPDGSRNPHSWSIVDEPILADWILKHFVR